MCVGCALDYKNSYPEVWMSADQPGMKEEILQKLMTTTTMEVIVHHNIFQHVTVVNRTVYREATMQTSQKEKWANQQNRNSLQNISECVPLKKTRRNSLCCRKMVDMH